MVPEIMLVPEPTICLYKQGRTSEAVRKSWMQMNDCGCVGRLACKEWNTIGVLVRCRACRDGGCEQIHG